MGNRAPFADGEWYHCYTRGVDKRKVFQSTVDYRRFVETLYLSNGTETVRRSDLVNASHAEIFARKRGKQLVAIGAYALMPNHFHILLEQKQEGGVARFMQKLGTAYTMYFNLRHERTGNLFVGPFKSRHVDDDRYLEHVAQYIHLNPAELSEPDWKKGKVKDMRALETSLASYEFSSYQDYIGKTPRPERGILAPDAMKLIGEELPPLKEALKDAADYYESINGRSFATL
jgi:putative transposase